jgi:hypothetical protein
MPRIEICKAMPRIERASRRLRYSTYAWTLY